MFSKSLKVKQFDQEEYGQFIHQELPKIRIKEVKMGVLSDKQIEQKAKTYIRSASSLPNEIGGLLDQHLGSLSESTRCLSCNHTRKLCQGHSGCYTLKYPYIIPQYETNAYQILKKICLQCHRMVNDSKKCSDCKILAPIIKSQKGHKVEIVFDGSQQTLTPQNIKEHFKLISLETSKQLGLGIHPQDIICNNIYISPIMTRPDKRVQQSVRNSDDFTVSLQGIIKQANRLNEMNEQDPNFDKLYDSFIQTMRNYHKGEKNEDDGSNTQTKALKTSIDGKEGNIRRKMLGKRVSKSARTVIACDTSIAPDQVVFPLEFAKTMFMKEVVRPYNYKRLEVLFKNGPDIYPGAEYIVKKDGQKYYIGNVNVTMEEGDILYRHLQDGDPVLMNRQPTLLPMSFGTHKIKVSEKENHDTFDLNIMSNDQYHFDFDGDEMNSLICNHVQSLVEMKYLSTPSNRIISYINGKLLIGQKQDSIIGGYLLTREEVNMDLMFTIRLHSNTSLNLNMVKFGDKISGKQALSLNLPLISYQGKSAYYDPIFSKYIQYKPSDEKFIVELGEIKSGYYDKGVQDFEKLMALTLDSQLALNTLFSIQQTILNFNKYCGLSIGFKDIYQPVDIRKDLHVKRQQTVERAYELIDRYSKNTLINPVGESRFDHFKEKLHDIFADDGIDIVMRSSLIKGNKIGSCLTQMALTGSKGTMSNLKAMLCNLGVIIVDNQPIKMLFQGRLNMFNKKNDLNPLAQGIIANSYLNGLSPQDLLTNIVPERVQMLQKVLSVAKPGYYGRKFIKNLENILIENTRVVYKPNAIYQMLFGQDGFKIECLGKQKIPFINMTYREVEQTFHKVIPQNANQQLLSICKDHIQEFISRLTLLKETLVENQFVNNHFTISDLVQTPVMVETFLKTTHQQILLEKGKIDEKEQLINLKENLVYFKEFLELLPYMYLSQKLRLQKVQLPQVYQQGMNGVVLCLYSACQFDIIKDFNPQSFELFLRKIALNIQHALIEPGTTIGVTSAQAIQEYFTQDLLDAIHRAGGKNKTSYNPLERIIDLFNNRTPQELDALDKPLPIIRIPLKLSEEPEEVQKQRAEIIANNIKLIQLRQLIHEHQILFGTLERPEDKLRIEDKHLFADNPEFPPNVSQWCLRLRISKMKLYLNRISLNEIKVAIQQNFNTFILASNETDQNLTIRIYLGEPFEFTNRHQLYQIIDDLLDFNIRGIKNIISAYVKVETVKTLEETGKITNKNRYVIIAEGYNLRDLFKLQTTYQEIDFQSISCDNHYLVTQFFGKSAARHKIYNEIKGVFEQKFVDNRHISFISSVLFQIGKLTSIESDGLRLRNPDADLIAISESRAVNSILKSALQQKTSVCQSVSDNTLIGQLPRFGSSYNTVILNTDFIQKQVNTQQQIQNMAFDFF